MATLLEPAYLNEHGVYMAISNKHKTVAIAVTTALLFLIYYWSTSAERTFINAIRAQVKADATMVDLSEYMNNEWETVCLSNGYDGPLTLRKYGRTYQPVGDAQDGAWGLIFIRPDGAFDAVSGGRRYGFQFDFGCLDRKAAKLKYLTERDVWVKY
jgi:hypothetical protein